MIVAEGEPPTPHSPNSQCRTGRVQDAAELAAPVFDEDSLRASEGGPWYNVYAGRTAN